MPSLKALKNRIGSVKNTRKITKAMQMVAAAKLRRAQEAAEAARPYADRMSAVMAGRTAAAAGSERAPRLLAGTGSDQRHLLVVMTSERGLAGGFNSSIVRLARQHADRLRAEGKDVAILTVGKKGREQLKREYSKLFVHHVDLSEVKKVGYENAREIADEILNRFEAGDFDVATLFYSRFESVIAQIPTATAATNGVGPGAGSPATSWCRAPRRNGRCPGWRRCAFGSRSSRRSPPTSGPTPCARWRSCRAPAPPGGAARCCRSSTSRSGG